MPSSADRKRLEVPTYLYDRLVEIAVDEDRTVSSVVQEVIAAGLSTYQSRSLGGSHGERYTERALRALDYARAETVRFNHNYIGTEHILAGLLREEEGIAARVLTQLGVTLDTVRGQIAYIIGQGKGSVSALENLPFVPRARKALRFAETEADAMEQHYVGTEHLLLGVVRVTDGMAANILNSLGVRDQVRPEMLRVIEQRPHIVPYNADGREGAEECDGR